MDITSTLSGIIPASFKGIPIQVYSYDVTKAPQIHIHNGAYWIKPQIEQLGRAPTAITIKGFLAGDFALLERVMLQGMILSPGPGLLTLPTYGVFYCVCISSTFSEDISNIIEVQLEFLEVESPLGDTIGSLMSGSLPDSVTTAISNVTASATSALSGAVGSASNAVAGIFS